MAKVVQVDERDPDASVIAEAAELIRAGELVAFPTETVYGLGANALEHDAVAKIFTAKGRPATNPLIVHVCDFVQGASLTDDWTENAAMLAEAFWPGPLTIVLKKSDMVPDIVTAGGDTVALRCPDHPVALALLNACELPIAAPSANRSTGISPTRAEHVIKSLGDRIPLILDGGPCRIGIESTVVDATGDAVRILRPGWIDAARIEAVTGPLDTAGLLGAARSPGLMEKHYSPQSRLLLAVDESDAQRLAAEWAGRARIISELTTSVSPEVYAANLYAILHECDGLHDALIVVLPPDRVEWHAIRDRLTRAASD